jgi:NAD(P)-dependent dehydrogenase (short-subunit alcohol dehydrogenase family)
MLETNLKGLWLTSKHVGKHFIERGEGGKIVNTSSSLGIVGGPLQAHYSSAKHGVLGLTKTLALELAEHDVNVNAVCPTAVDTPMVEESMKAYGEEVFSDMTELAGPMSVFDPDDPATDPKDISEAFMWLSSEASKYVTGITLPVDAGHTIK